MIDILNALAPFRLDSQLDECFELIYSGATLQRSEEMNRALRDYKIKGVYFWLLKFENSYYRIYVGKTVSVSGRLGTYVGGFQAHAPNDYKLQVFFAFVNKILPDALFCLYFYSPDGDPYEAERIAIKKYNPLLNKLPQPDAEAKEKLQNAFSFYYESIFKKKLNLQNIY